MNDMTEFEKCRRIERELSMVENGDARSWGNLYLLLDAVDQSGYWEREAASFTSWIEKSASRLHSKPAMLWRILSAGRFVQLVAERFKERGFVIPSLEEMPDAVSPENVELLSKLGRVAPEDIFEELVHKVFDGEATRSKLREAWETYRPALGGKTARGRGVAAPKLNQQDPVQYRSMMEAVTLDALQAVGPTWTGVKSPSVYKFFVHVNPERYCMTTDLYLFAAVVVIKHKNGPLQYHGICFQPLLEAAGSYENILAYCDHLWVLNHDHNNKMPELVDDSSMPDCIGVLKVRGSKVSVIRPAGVVEGSGSKRLDLASALLTRALRAK